MAKKYTLKIMCINCNKSFDVEIPYGRDVENALIEGLYYKTRNEKMKDIICPSCGSKKVTKD